VTFIGGSSDHDVGELSAQVVIDRVMIESAAGDEYRQQIRFRCDHVVVQLPIGAGTTSLTTEQRQRRLPDGLRHRR
jgi:hypothetical protein